MLLQNFSSSLLGRTIFWATMAAATLIVLTTLLGLSSPVAAFGRPSTSSHASSSTNHSSTLAELALGKVLHDASPIFGDYVDVSSNTSTWWEVLYSIDMAVLIACRMKSYADETLLVHMNIPGTHDAATWYVIPILDCLLFYSSP